MTEYDDISQWDTVAKVVDHIVGKLRDNNDIENANEMLDPDFVSSEDKEPVDPIILFSCRQQFGRDIRNNFGLWRGNVALARDCINVDPETATGTFRMWSEDKKISDDDLKSLLCGEVHPDDASSVIEKQLLKRLKEEVENAKT